MVFRIPPHSTHRAMDHVSIAGFAWLWSRENNALALADGVEPHLRAFDGLFVPRHGAILASDARFARV